MTELMTVQGWSMSPWLKTDDVVAVDRSVSEKDLMVGDVVVLENKILKKKAIHRVIEINPNHPWPLCLVTKGDRIPYIDGFGKDWTLLGKAVGRFRNNKYTILKFKKILAFISKHNLYRD